LRFSADNWGQACLAAAGTSGPGWSLCGAGLRFRAGTPRPEPAERPEELSLEQFVPEELLQKLEAARSGGGMVGERRTVTMLFYDVKGPTAAAEQLGPTTRQISIDNLTLYHLCNSSQN
jgi:class 3 adenylate cyclase